MTTYVFQNAQLKRSFRIKGVWIIVRSSLCSMEGRVIQSVPRVSLNTIKHVLTLARTVHLKNTKNVSITAPVDTIDMNHIVLKRVLPTISSIIQIIYVNKCEGFKYYQQKNIFCLNTCPEKTVEINSTCVSHCPKSRPFLHKMSCLAECPVSSKYFEQKNEPDNIITYTCVEKCKK